MSARQLIDAGREHVAAGRPHDAVRCFSLAADDPADGHEARSMLAAAYLLPGTTRPSLALRHVRWLAAARSVAHEHLTRGALVALCAGDASLAEELAGRAADHHLAALPILAAAKARLGDRAEVGRLLAGVRLAAGPAAFWHRLVIEALRRRWFREALAACRTLRRSDLPIPKLELLVRAVPPPLLGLALLAGTGLALALPQPLAAGSLLGVVSLATGAARVDLDDGRLASALAAGTWTASAAIAVLARWMG